MDHSTLRAEPGPGPAPTALISGEQVDTSRCRGGCDLVAVHEH